MSRTPMMQDLGRWLRIAMHCEHSGESVAEALGRSRESATIGRRRVLQAAAGLGLASSLPLRAQPKSAGANVAVVGAGFAGLNAARMLSGKGAQTQVFEAADRVGGRVWTLRGFFPSQVAERGAELIDTGHTTVLGLVRAYKLTLDDYAPSKLPGEPFYYFGGQHWSEEQVVEEFCEFIPAMKRDLKKLSKSPSASSYTEADRQLDLTPLSDYLVQRGAGPLIRAVLDVAYTIEFGRETSFQSSLAFLFFASTKCTQTFKPFGESDERYHIVEGNDTLATRMAAELSQPVRLGHRLLKVARQADGRVRLSFATAGGTVETQHDAVILTLPAPMMREIEFASSAALPAENQFAIAQLDYGTNSKLMVGFNGRPWYERNDSNGSSYSDLPNLQNTWETNPSLSKSNKRGVLTDFTGGNLGARLDPTQVQNEAQAFLTDLDRVYPGSAALARRDGKGIVQAHLENWSKLPLFKGAYTNNQPGYFTTLEGLYARPAGNIYFAGEHTDSFYSYQGFMEGALLSGARAAEEAMRKL